jgi:Lrp/AsnC family transcriptional regulator for asnA, asnC and gidA
MDYEIDNLDREILRILQQDARTPYVEIARELNVSGGTIHVRVGKMKAAGVLLGTKQMVNYRALGYEVTALVGLRVTGASGIQDVCEKLKTIPEIVEVHYTTGAFSLIAKIMARSMADLYELLAGKLREHTAIASTETFLVLNTKLQREPEL